MVTQGASGKRVSYKKLLADKELELKETTEALQRLQAEFDNFRKRTELEKAEIIAKASKDIVIKVLDVIDSLSKATKDSPDAEGFSMVKNQMEDILAKEGLEQIDIVGQEFNPELHDAITTHKSDKKAGSIIQEIRKGYKFKGEVIRPTQVIISRGDKDE